MSATTNEAGAGVSTRATELPAGATTFLRALGQGLASLPPGERDEIVAEVEAHLRERHAAGAEAPEADFGPPEDYAGQFLDERALAGAVADGTTLALGRALFARARSLAEAVLVVGPLFFLQGVSVLLLVLAALKPVLFQRVGYFTNGRGGAWVGFSDGSSGDVDVLGWWTVPAFALPALAVLVGSRRVLAALARRRLARTRSSLGR